MTTRHQPWSTWFAGTRKDWEAMPIEEREALAFTATRCEVAWPTWQRPVDCVHLSCKIRRGDAQPIALTNAILRGERDRGWYRDVERDTCARLFRIVRAIARRTGIYDPWKQGCAVQTIVIPAVMS